MGLKFYRASNRPRKIRKRLTNTRTFFSTHKWVSYFAHPNLVPGHPFKGGMWAYSQGMLLNPEIKRFAIFSPLFFKPVRPGAGAEDVTAEKTFIESSDKLAEAYTGSAASWGSERCQAFKANLDKCFTSSVKGGNDPEQQCQYYVQSLKREVCTG
mmetsp:Transcript_5880/g.6629  ORF Transcript_5880/g.6629 Transcript_5880/m.6629 type:complete len:155 (+) Transcript_5880:32-496(+)|eukprot:CAMPEP_0205799088 /NCGR_PEP_ID=MMETSP0205-20121125/229_1 /ASSEMBLY_ACC=CAM_ASM_000278 /TAXON_ID=36767 /ORGANISM="Euplotes focardii, Strain TN1" /LENGTH=154 /DNA_ID=CAMNT_0053059791 /DNA_START=21 /DNA_END=488 /DNA_ORIENTATION=-